MPIWMKMLPMRAATNAPTRRWSLTWTAAAVPTITGAIAAGRVRGRAAISQIRKLPTRYGRFGNFEKSGRRPST